MKKHISNQFSGRSTAADFSVRFKKNMKINTPFYLHIPIYWGYDDQALIYNAKNEFIGSIQNIYTPSEKQILGMPLTANSVLKWKTKENKFIGKVVIKNEFPLAIEAEESTLTINAKDFSILPILEFIDKNDKIIFSMKHKYKHLVFISSDSKLKYEMYKIKSKTKGYILWKINSCCKEFTIDHRLVLGFIATSMMDTGTPG